MGVSRTDAHSELDGLRNLDSQAVGAVYDRYFPEVYRYVRYRIGDEALAEDVASEVFMHLLEAVHARRGPQTNLRGWLMGTASHLVTNHLRRRYSRPTEALAETTHNEQAGLAEQVEHREDIHALRRAMSRLTEEQQHVLALRFGEGYSLEETAALMKKNVNAVKQCQFRALAALNCRIEEAA